jgi:hypothetical protein
LVLAITVTTAAEVLLTFANAAGLRLADSFNCAECCGYNRTFEISYDQTTWLPVQSSQLKGNSVTLTLAPNIVARADGAEEGQVHEAIGAEAAKPTTPTKLATGYGALTVMWPPFVLIDFHKHSI